MNFFLTNLPDNNHLGGKGVKNDNFVQNCLKFSQIINPWGRREYQIKSATKRIMTLSLHKYDHWNRHFTDYLREKNYFVHHCFFCNKHILTLTSKRTFQHKIRFGKCLILGKSNLSDWKDANFDFANLQAPTSQDTKSKMQ